MSESATSKPAAAVSKTWQETRALLDLVLDFSFKHFVTPRLIRTLYALSLLAAVISALTWMFSGFASGSIFYGLFTLITGPVAFLIYVIIARVALEVVLVIFRIAENLERRPVDQPAPPPADDAA